MDKKKLFALASFTAITGIMVATTAAGCSSSSSSTTTPTDGGKSDAKPPPPPPPPVVGDDGGGDDGGKSGCPPTTPIDAASLPWEDPAAPNLNQCTEANIKAMADAIKAGSVKTDDDLKAAIGGAAGTCSKCVFTDATKAPWGPLPEVNDPKAGNQAVTVNVGGCYALGLKNNACGKALQNLEDCKFTACFDDACPANPTSTQLQNCFTAAEKGACKAIAASIQTACAGIQQAQLDAVAADCEPDSRPDGSKTEYTFEGPVRVQCITGITGG
jgi:hypothetical protein